MMDLDNLISDFSSLKLSAISKSIQINKFVDKVTLGPSTTVKSSPTKAPDISRRIHQTNAVDSPKTSTNNHISPKQIATLSPQQQTVLCMTNRVLTGLEKSRKETETQSIEMHLQKIELFNKQQEARRIQRWKHQQALKLQEIQQEEQLILQAMKQVETQSIIELSLARTKAEDQRKLQKLYMDYLKTEQDTAALIRDIDGLFKNNQEAKTELTKYENPFKQLFDSYKHMNAKLRSEKIAEGDIESANTVLSQTKQLKGIVKNSIKDHYQKREKEAAVKVALLKKNEEEAKALQVQKKQQEEQKLLLEQQKQQQLHNQQSLRDVATPLVHRTSSEVSSTTLEDDKIIVNKYKEFQTFLQSHQQTYQQLLNDQSLKQFKSDCKKAVNFPVNGISAVNSEHLRDKYAKLHSLLSGKTVQISDARINAAQHPQGIAFVMDLLAKKFVIQGELTIANNPDAAFAYATIIITLWNDFPIFGQLVLAYFYKSCPYLVPIVFQKQDGQTDEDFYISRGYKYEDGVIEKQDKFLKRMTGISKLYFSILISHTKRGSPENPHNLMNGWTWLARTLNRVPSVDITATVIYSFLEVAGSSMQETYGKQFKKLITYIIQYQIPLLKNKDTGGPLVRLEVMLQKYGSTGILQKPAKLSPNFW